MSYGAVNTHKPPPFGDVSECFRYMYAYIQISGYKSCYTTFHTRFESILHLVMCRNVSYTCMHIYKYQAISVVIPRFTRGSKGSKASSIW